MKTKNHGKGNKSKKTKNKMKLSRVLDFLEKEDIKFYLILECGKKGNYISKIEVYRQ